MKECPIEFADKLGQEFFSIASESKATLGQYFTPYEVADFMAKMLKPVNKETIRLLDPGAGTGVLASAVVKALAQHPSNRTKGFHVELFEIDSSLIPKLKSSLNHLRSWCTQHNLKLTYKIKSEDFILSCSSALERQTSLFQNNNQYDVAISNPPYFKISKDDPRSLACSDIIYGQPNIYALFMALSAALLNNGGRPLFFSPPRFSFGPYF